MLQNALAAALVLYALILGLILKECVFLAPLRSVIWEQYGERLLWMSLVAVLNLFAALYGVLRTLSLKNTGDKLTHLEKQLKGRATLSEELTERIRNRK